jgi:hypothetical protein
MIQSVPIKPIIFVIFYLTGNKLDFKISQRQLTFSFVIRIWCYKLTQEIVQREVICERNKKVMILNFSLCVGSFKPLRCNMNLKRCFGYETL